jgi:hypothetical protein
MINGPGKKVDFHTLVLLKTLLFAQRAAAAIIIIYCSALFLSRQAREVRAGASLFSLRRLVANLLALRWA